MSSVNQKPPLAQKPPLSSNEREGRRTLVPIRPSTTQRSKSNVEDKTRSSNISKTQPEVIYNLLL